MEISDQPAANGHEKLRLKVAAGNAAGSVIEVEDELIIGRQAAGAGSLANDIEISRRHARITSDAEGRYSIEDLGSTNGTYVNGRAIETPVVLEPGDRIEVGATALVVQVRAVTPRSTPVTTTSDIESALGDVARPSPAEAEPAEVEAEAPAAETDMEAPVVTGFPSPARLPPLDLQFEFDVERGEVTIRIADGGDEVRVVHTDGAWRLAL